MAAVLIRQANRQVKRSGHIANKVKSTLIAIEDAARLPQIAEITGVSLEIETLNGMDQVQKKASCSLAAIFPIF